MLRQAVAAVPRTLRIAPRASSANLARPQTYAAATPVFRSFQPAASRWYSDAESGKKDDKASEATSEEKGATDEVSELKKSLEAKDAEAREWKVRCPQMLLAYVDLIFANKTLLWQLG